jgi:hypothetical protein
MREWIGTLVRVRDTPEALARGLAVGVFFGVSLLWGLQIVAAVLVSHLVRGNKVVAAAATTVSNPLTTVPLYSFCYVVGHLFVSGPSDLPGMAELQTLDGILGLGLPVLTTLLLGTSIVGAVASVAVYLFSSRLLTALRRWHERRRPPDEHSPPARRSPTWPDSRADVGVGSRART